jgi:hypothetical protein
MASKTIEKVLKLKDEASPALKKVGGEASKTAKKVDKLGDEAKETGSQVKVMGDKAGSAAAKTRRAGESAKASAAAFKGMALAAAAGAVAILGAAKALIALNQRLVDSKNDLLDTSVKTGLMAETIGGLRLAAKGSGQELGNLASGLTQFPKRMADASRGTGEAMIAFNQLGIEVNDASGTMRTADAVLRETMDALAGVEDATQRSALATQAFGKAGTNLMVALSGESLERFIALSKEFGVNIGPQGAKAAAEWQREVALFDTTMDGLLDQMVTAAVGAGGMADAFGLVTLAIKFMTEVLENAFEALRAFLVGGVAVAVQQFTALSMLIRGDVAGAWDELKQSAEAALDVLRAGMTVMGGLFDLTSLIDAGLEVKDFRDKLAELNGTKVKVEVEWGTSPLDPSLAAPFTGTFDMMAAVKQPKAPSGGGGPSELERMTKKVAALVKRAFPVTQIEKAAKLLVRLEKAETAARSSRKAGFTALIVQATEAKAALETVEITKMTDKIGADLDGMAKGMEGLDAALLDLTASTAQMIEDLALAQREAISSGIQIGAGALSDLSGALGALGPVGGAVGAVAGLGEAAAGEEGGLEALVTQNVEGFVNGMVALLEQLPDVISRVIPILLAEGIPKLIVALAKAAPALAKAILIDLPLTLTQAFGDAFAAAWDAAWDAVQKFFRDLFSMDGLGGSIKDGFMEVITLGMWDSKQTGGFVNRTGLTMLHAGEVVQPTSGTMPQSARGRMGGGGGGGVNITINTNVVDPNAIDQLGRMLQRHFGAMGRTTLPIFGGG